MHTDAPIANGDPAMHCWTAAELVELYRKADPINWEQLLRERLRALGATDPVKFTSSQLAEFKRQVFWAANRAGISDPAAWIADRAQREATAAVAASANRRPLVETGDMSTQRKSTEREPVTLENSPATTSAASPPRPVARMFAWGTTKAEVLSRIKAAIEAGESPRTIADGLAFAQGHFHASQREIGRAVGRDPGGWVNRFLKWRKYGYKDASPFGPTTRAERAVLCQLRSPNNIPAAPTRSSRKGDDDGEVSSVPHSSPAEEPASLPGAAGESHQSASIQTEPVVRADAATRETKNPRETIVPRDPAREPDGSDSRQPEKQKLPTEHLEAWRKLSPERMRIILDALRVYPVLKSAAAKAGIRPKTLAYWIRRSEAGDDGYDIKWQGITQRFHEHCEAAIAEARQKLDDEYLRRAIDGYEKVLTNRGRVVYKIDQELAELGFQGPDAYLRDENGKPVPETIHKEDTKAQQYVLKRHRSGTWGKHPKIDAPREGGVLVIGDVTKKPKYNTDKSVRARRWKADSRRLREEKD
jgi:hypothetical protein